MTFSQLPERVKLASETQLVGTPSQIEWALQIRRRVGDEFDPVVGTLRRAAHMQREQDQVDTQAMIAILEEKCNRGAQKQSSWLLYPALGRADRPKYGCYSGTTPDIRQ